MPHIECINTLEAFEALAEPWDALVLASRFPAPMLLHDWASCWFHTCGKAYQPEILVVWEEGKLVAAAPLCRRRLCVGPAPVCDELRTLGAVGVAGLYYDFPVHAQASPDVFHLLVEALTGQEHWHRLRLERMVSGSGVLEAFRSQHLLPKGMIAECAEATPCPVLPLPDSMEALEAGMDPIFRTMLHRKNLKLAPSRHAVEFVPAIGTETLEADLHRLFEVHTVRWAQAGHAGEFALEDRKQFFRQLAPRLLAKGWLRFSKLQLDGQGHCYYYGVQLGDQYFALQTGISQEGLACHAGIFTMYQLMRQLVPSAAAFHFMEGGEAYKFKWGARPQMAYTMQAWQGVRGQAMWQLRRVRQTMQDLRHSVTSRLHRPGPMTGKEHLSH
ncbi:GNAT family N-acetyltransferase [Megalodesulfovibrio paquesii]